MGLINLLANVFYNYKLNKALQLVTSCEYDLAEKALIELIPKHPDAVSELSNMYLKRAQDSKDCISYCIKALDCESKIDKLISNTDSFKVSKDKTLDLLYSKFKNSCSNADKSEAIKFSTVLYKYRKDDNFLKEHFSCLFDYLNSVPNSSLVDYESLMIQIYNGCKDKGDLSLIKDKSLEKLYERAKFYYEVKDYTKTKNLCILLLDENLQFKELYIRNCLDNIQSVLKEQEQVNILLKIVCSLKVKMDIISYLELIVRYTDDAKPYYNKYIIEVSNENIKYNKFLDAITLLEKAISIYEDRTFSDQLILICKVLINNASYDLAVKTLINIDSKHPDAQPLLAKCYFKKSNLEKANDLRKELLLKAFKFKNSHNQLFNSVLYDEIFPDVIKGLLTVAYKFGEFSYYADAYQIIEFVKPFEPLSLNTFIKVKVLEINNITSIDKQIKLYKETIESVVNKIASIENSKSIEVKVLISELIKATLNKIKNCDNDTAINELISLREDIRKFSFSSIKLDSIIADKFFNKGIEFEKLDKLDQAEYCYKYVIDDFPNISDIRSNALVRIQILYLKDPSVFISKISKDYIIELLNNIKRNRDLLDLAYRFAIFLITNSDLGEALDIIQKFLPNNHPSTKLLVNICQSKQIGNAKKILFELNSKIELLNQGILDSKDAITLLSEIKNIENECKILQVAQSDFITLNKGLINSIILKAFENECFAEAFNYIKEYVPDFIENDFWFRNIASAAFGMLATQKMDAYNFKELLSILITTIFTDRLFIHSLHYSLWDDKFTFTLEDSLGSLTKEEEKLIPANVNYEDKSDLNISIGDVQRSLLDSLENLITKNPYQDDLKNLATEFLQSEIDAITSLYRLKLYMPSPGCTPYFASQNLQIFEKISNSLTNELDLSYNNHEDVLKVGLLYGINKEPFKKYSDAIILKNKAIEVVKQGNTVQLKLIFSKSNIQKIYSYKELYTVLCNEIITVFKEHIKEETNFEKTISDYLIVCQSLPDSSLNYLLSNFANKSCISKLNDEVLSISSGLKILGNVYLIIRSNEKLNENLQSLINAAVMDLIMKSEKTILNVIFHLIDNVPTVFDKGIIDTLNKTVEMIVISGKIEELRKFIAEFKLKTNYKNALSNILSEAMEIEVNISLSNLIDELSSKRISEIDCFERTFKLYQKNKNHERVCQNLAIIAGNVIHSDVMLNTRSSSRITNILDALLSDRSVTFKQFAFQFAEQRKQIIDSLPRELRELMNGRSLDYHTLTPQGLALKKGLLYLESLSR